MQLLTIYAYVVGLICSVDSSEHYSELVSDNESVVSEFEVLDEISKMTVGCDFSLTGEGPGRNFEAIFLSVSHCLWRSCY